MQYIIGLTRSALKKINFLHVFVTLGFSLTLEELTFAKTNVNITQKPWIK